MQTVSRLYPTWEVKHRFVYVQVLLRSLTVLVRWWSAVWPVSTMNLLLICSFLSVIHYVLESGSRSKSWSKSSPHPCVKVEVLIEYPGPDPCQDQNSRFESESESGSDSNMDLQPIQDLDQKSVHGVQVRIWVHSESRFAYRSMSWSGLSKLIAIPRVCIIYLTATKNNR